MKDPKLTTALLNSGLPQLAEKLQKGEELTKGDYKTIYNQIKDFDNYYLKGWKESTTRQILVEELNNISIIYRWQSLIIK